MVGTATTLVTVYVPLKETNVEETFSTSVVFDTIQGSTPMIMPDQNNLKTSNRLAELFRLGNPIKNVNGHGVSTLKRPEAGEDPFSYGGELLQYQLFHSIVRIQKGIKKSGMSFGNSFAIVTKALRLPDPKDYGGTLLSAIVAGNRFSDSYMEEFEWKNAHVSFPQKTNVRFLHRSPAMTGSTETFIVRLQKPRYFTIDFSIDPLPSTGPGIFPSGITLSPELAAHCQTYNFQITMRATFNKITSGNSKTEEYKNWASQLFSGLREDLAD